MRESPLILDLIAKYLSQRVRVLRAETAAGPEVIFFGKLPESSPLLSFASFVDEFLPDAGFTDLPVLARAYRHCLRHRTSPVEYADLDNSLRAFSVWLGLPGEDDER